MDKLIKHKNTTIITPTSKLETGEKALLHTNMVDKLKHDYEKAHELLDKKFREALNVTAPEGVILPGSQILVTALPPYVQKTTMSGIILSDQLDSSQKELDRVKNSTDNVADYQKVLTIGIGAKNYFKENLREGDFVKISFDRYRSLADGSMDGRVSTTYRIPTTMINGVMYIVLDYMDITYIHKQEFVDQMYK